VGRGGSTGVGSRGWLPKIIKARYAYSLVRKRNRYEGGPSSLREPDRAAWAVVIGSRWIAMAAA